MKDARVMGGLFILKLQYCPPTLTLCVMLETLLDILFLTFDWKSNVSKPAVLGNVPLILCCQTPFASFCQCSVNHTHYHVLARHQQLVKVSCINGVDVERDSKRTAVI